MTTRPAEYPREEIEAALPELPELVRPLVSEMCYRAWLLGRVTQAERTLGKLRGVIV